ncbi:hypothetical protein ElyMa_003665800 [Elysia marginata]|uniref:Secreted protein n=1 Tax=Elysia marginata TaxID=1093978 RepID=A0AAV4EZZ1_9GAST|nr:hypothetical protein ElyMa_003665800 [Elysia marginata]
MLHVSSTLMEALLGGLCICSGLHLEVRDCAPTTITFDELKLEDEIFSHSGDWRNDRKFLGLTLTDTVHCTVRLGKS